MLLPASPSMVPATAAPTVVVTVAPVADKLTLAPFAGAVSATINGVAATITAYAWAVSGPATVANDTTATPTFTPTGGGVIARSCAVTVGGIVYQSAVETLTVGAQDATSKRWWVKLWEFIPADLADHNFVASALTVDGVEVRNGSEGAVTSLAISGGVLTVDTAPAGAIGGLWIYPVQARDDTMQASYCIIAGLGAELTADNDGVFLSYSNNGGSIFGLAEAYRTAGAQRLRVTRAGSVTGNKATTAGAQARVIGMEWAPGRQSFRPLWSATAWSGSGPAPGDLTPVALTPSGWHVAADVTPAETADEIPADNDVGSSPVELVWKCRAGNGRAYTLPGMTLWATL